MIWIFFSWVGGFSSFDSTKSSCSFRICLFMFTKYTLSLKIVWIRFRRSVDAIEFRHYAVEAERKSHKWCFGTASLKLSTHKKNQAFLSFTQCKRSCFYFWSLYLQRIGINLQQREKWPKWRNVNFQKLFDSNCISEAFSLFC